MKNYNSIPFTAYVPTGVNRLKPEEMGIQDKEQILIEAEVEFSHLNVFSEAEYKKAIEKSKYPKSPVNYRKIVLRNPRLIGATSDNIAQYLSQHMYERNGSIKYSFEFNAAYAPHMFKATTGNWDNPIEVTAENFLKESTIRVLFNTFTTDQNMGLGIDSILGNINAKVYEGTSRYDNPAALFQVEDSQPQGSPFGGGQTAPQMQPQANPFGGGQASPQMQPQANPFGGQASPQMQAQANPFGGQASPQMQAQANPFGGQTAPQMQPQANPFGRQEETPAGGSENPFSNFFGDTSANMKQDDLPF
ncbi:hypothetical protein LLJM1_04370 (plasmid) [Lactococcus cremoris]|uniref:Uncharacterized protein n=1 Tax=Lactococcus lactis subsp. cremoris TaxID=1359 RepID=A0A1V0PDE9_LACLC|nr:hypothetical protein [Lactococcus cremoris]ARE27216.1 hypothetical protein LLJM1_04370 [Lactococcus cremoris]